MENNERLLSVHTMSPILLLKQRHFKSSLENIRRKKTGCCFWGGKECPLRLPGSSMLDPVKEREDNSGPLSPSRHLTASQCPEQGVQHMCGTDWALAFASFSSPCPSPSPPCTSLLPTGTSACQALHLPSERCTSRGLTEWIQTSPSTVVGPAGVT